MVRISPPSSSHGEGRVTGHLRELKDGIRQLQADYASRPSSLPQSDHLVHRLPIIPARSHWTPSMKVHFGPTQPSCPKDSDDEGEMNAASHAKLDTHHPHRTDGE